MALRPSRRLSAALSGLQEYCSCSWTDLGVMDKTASLRGARAPLADRMTRRIAIHGPVFWSGMLAGRLREVGFRATGFSSGGGHLGGQVRFLWWFLRQMAHRSIVHMLTAYTGSRLARLARMTGTPLIYHWIGTDTLRLTHLPQDRQRMAVRNLNRLVPVHLADSPEIADELATAGLNVAEVVRLLPGSVRAEIMPLPPRPAVMCYWNDPYAEFHRAGWIMDLARRFPDVPFRIAAATGQGLQAPPNVHFLGWQKDLNDVYRSCTIFLRLVRHDSLSAMVLEALARGRHVIYTKDVPHCRHVQTLEQAAGALSELIAAADVNEAGATWVRANFDPAEEISKLASVYRAVDRKVACDGVGI